MSLGSVYQQILRMTGDGKVCPAHEDEHGSLSVTLQKDKILLNCHAGCDFDVVLEALDLRPMDLLIRVEELLIRKLLDTDMKMKTVAIYLMSLDSNPQKHFANRLLTEVGVLKMLKRYPFNFGSYFGRLE